MKDGRIITNQIQPIKTADLHVSKGEIKVNGDKQKLLDVLNGVTLAHNAFVSLDREKYPKIPNRVWEIIAIGIRELSAKLETLCLLED